MASWRDEIQGGGVATFRGVPFQVARARSTHGRRNVDHEYPQRDRNYVEDMGRKSRPFTLVGFVVGDDYRSQLEACIAAAEHEGAGVLLHPYRGTLTVNCDSLDVEESTEEGRTARLTWTFKDSGALTFPQSDQETAEAARLQAQVAEASAAVAFAESWNTTGPGFVLATAQDSLQDTVDALRAAVDPVFDAVDDFAAFTLAVDDFEADITTIAATPATIAIRLRAIGATIGNLKAFRALSDASGTAGPSDAVTVAGISEQTNAEAVLRLQVQLALAGAVTTISGADFTSINDAEDARDELAGRINAEAEIVINDDLYAELVDLRTVLVEYVDAEFQDLPALRAVAVPVLMASVVLAWDLYGDADRDGEINTRNNVQHPLFLSPQQTLQVLTS